MVRSAHLNRLAELRNRLPPRPLSDNKLLAGGNNQSQVPLKLRFEWDLGIPIVDIYRQSIPEYLAKSQNVCSVQESRSGAPGAAVSPRLSTFEVKEQVLYQPAFLKL